jgi:hypothetical protein
MSRSNILVLDKRSFHKEYSCEISTIEKQVMHRSKNGQKVVKKKKGVDRKDKRATPPIS